MPDEPTPLRARLLGVHARAHLVHGLDERPPGRPSRRSAWPRSSTCRRWSPTRPPPWPASTTGSATPTTAQRVAGRDHRAARPRRRRRRRDARPLPARRACTSSAATWPTPASLPRRPRRWPGSRAALGALRLRRPAAGGAGRLPSSATGTTSCEVTDGSAARPRRRSRRHAARHPCDDRRAAAATRRAELVLDQVRPLWALDGMRRHLRRPPPRSTGTAARATSRRCWR